MKTFVCLLFCSLFLSFEWVKDYELAKEIAQKENKYILLNFSGSDWSGPCKKMRKGLFADSVFVQFAQERLIIVNIDFPKDMKGISVDQNAKNEALADQLNPEGEFPMTLLLDKDGIVVEKWSGMIKMDAREFVRNMESSILSEKK